MSARDFDQVKREARDRLDFDPEAELNCNRILGMGLTEAVCQNDDSLKRWLTCQAAQLVVEEDRDLDDALAEAFDMAEDQCEFFDLEPPVERRTSFGALEAEEVRAERRTAEQGTLPVETEAGPPPELQPQRAEPDRGEQAGLGGGPSREETARATEEAERRQERREQEAEAERPRTQATLGGGEQARFSTFEPDEDDGDGGGRAPDTDCKPLQASIEQLIAASRGGTIDVDELRDRLQDAVDAGCITEDQANGILELTPLDDTPLDEPSVSTVTEDTADELFDRVQRAFARGSGNR